MDQRGAPYSAGAQGESYAVAHLLLYLKYWLWVVQQLTIEVVLVSARSKASNQGCVIDWREANSYEEVNVQARRHESEGPKGKSSYLRFPHP